MSKAPWTPGPWRVAQASLGSSPYIRGNVTGHDAICRMVPHQADSNEANARLIAAAPKMADELAGIYDDLDNLRGNLPNISAEHLAEHLDARLKRLGALLAEIGGAA